MKWGDVPAVAVPAVILTANVLLITQGVNNKFLHYSIALVLILFVLQAFFSEFLYLFPSNSFIGTKTVGFDTWLMRILIFASAVLFSYGATGHPGPSALLLIGGAVLLAFWWFILRHLSHHYVAEKMYGKRVNTAMLPCPVCQCIVSNVFFVGKSKSGEYEQLLLVYCDGRCKRNYMDHRKLNIRYSLWMEQK